MTCIESILPFCAREAKGSSALSFAVGVGSPGRPSRHLLGNPWKSEDSVHRVHWNSVHTGMVQSVLNAYYVFRNYVRLWVYYTPNVLPRGTKKENIPCACKGVQDSSLKQRKEENY